MAGCPEDADTKKEWERTHVSVLELKSSVNSLYKYASEADVKERRAIKKERAQKKEEYVPAEVDPAEVDPDMP